MSIRKFLKEVGVTSQRKIEETVRKGQFGGKTLKVRMGSLLFSMSLLK